MSYNIESNSLGQRTALSNCNNIPLLDLEGRRAMHSHVLMTLFITTVLGNEMKVILPNDDGALHLGGDDQSLEDTSTNGNASSEGALLIYVVSGDGGIGCFYSQTNVSYEADRLLLLATNDTLAGDEYGVLALVGLFVL